MTDNSEVSLQALSDLTVFMKYAKYRDDLGRRETWGEIVERNEAMHQKKFAYLGSDFSKQITSAYKLVHEKRILPSMRSCQFSGRPIELANSRIFNCAYLPIDDMVAFSEIMFLLLGGSGVGYSVQQHHVSMLPPVIAPTKTRRFVIGDSIEGWGDSIKVLMAAYLDPAKDYRPIYDASDVRPKGARLITSGGKAPGPEPLMLCLGKIEAILMSKKDGEKLTTVEVHDIVCVIADAVLAGGIRRAALIAIFSHGDLLMLIAKGNVPITAHSMMHDDGGGYYHTDVSYDDPTYGQKETTVYLDEIGVKQLRLKGTLPWYHFHPHRGRANNSAALLRGSVDYDEFMLLWQMVEWSGCGEPGIFWTNDLNVGSNPCMEIALEPFCFCNLSVVNAKGVKTQEELNVRVKAASFIGTLQASYTNFHYLRPIWQETTERDALLGVSITGLANEEFLGLDFTESTNIATEENSRVAEIIGINKAARVTTVKPDGTSSCVLGTSSGVHAWHNDYYVRRIRVKKNEAIYEYMQRTMPQLVEDDQFDANGAIFCIPIKSPESAIMRHETAIDFLTRVKLLHDTWIKPGHRSGVNTNNVSCFSGDTKFVTNKGMIRFDECRDGDLVSVLNHNGQFTEALVKNFGKQRIWNVKVSNGQTEKIIRTTEHHWWYIANNYKRFGSGGRPRAVSHLSYNLRRTADLTVIDKAQFPRVLPKLTPPKINVDALLHGIVFGDGTRGYKTKAGLGGFISLCHDSRQLKDFFIDAGYNKLIEKEDINQTYIGRLPWHWKELPNDDVDASYIYSFIAGWFAADGWISQEKRQISITCIQKNAMEWLQKYSVMVGIGVSNHIVVSYPKGYNRQETTAYSVSIFKDTLTSDFFVHPDKKAKFDKNHTTAQSLKWVTVLDVVETNDYEDVWCVIEPKNAAFVLEGFILTHNCTVTVKEHEWENVGQWMWDNRGSYGGISVLPHDGGTYIQAPFTDCTKLEYETLAQYMKHLDLTQVNEVYDETNLTGELACAGGACSI